MEPTTVIRSLDYLEGNFRLTVQMLQDKIRAAHEAGFLKARYEIFETFRSPIRQDNVFARGASKARAWQSAHQYGLAVDLAILEPSGRWTWDITTPDIVRLGIIRKELGNRLAPIIHWDPLHFESAKARGVLTYMNA